MRPGFADLSFFRHSSKMAALATLFNKTAALVGRGRLSQILCFQGNEWPAYMGWRQGESTLPDNLDAAAEVVVAFLRQLRNVSRGLLPAYIEPVNEPNARGISSGANASQVAAYETKVAVAVHEYLASVGATNATQVGGPALAGISVAHNSFRELPFLFWGADTGRQQFLSFHAFDGFAILTNGSALERRDAGGPVTAVFDLVEAYAMQTLGRRVPVLVSEHGLATDGTAGLLQHLPLEAERWHQIDSFWGQLLTLMPRADNILAVSSFLIDNSYADRTNPSVALFNATTATTTIVANATFGLLRQLDGLSPALQRVARGDGQQRILVQSFTTSETLAVAAAPALRVATIVLKSLAATPTVANVSLSGCTVPSRGHITATRVSRLSRDAAVTVSRTVLAAKQLGAFGLAALELAILQVPCAPSSEGGGSARRARLDRFYAHDTMKPVSEQTGGWFNTSLTIPVAAPAASSPVLFATLRIGYNLDFALNATASGVSNVPSVAAPSVAVNGASLGGMPTALRTDTTVPSLTQEWDGVWRAWEYAVPPAAIAPGSLSVSARFAPAVAPGEAANGAIGCCVWGMVSAVVLETYTSVA